MIYLIIHKSFKALKLNNDSVKANCKQGECLMHCRDYDKAVIYLKRALELSQSKEEKLGIHKIYQKLKAMRAKE